MTKANKYKILELFHKIYGDTYSIEKFIMDLVEFKELVPVNDYEYALTDRGLDLYPYLAEAIE